MLLFMVVGVVLALLFIRQTNKRHEAELERRGLRVA
jgi:hypothetical protein